MRRNATKVSIRDFWHSRRSYQCIKTIGRTSSSISLSRRPRGLLLIGRTHLDGGAQRVAIDLPSLHILEGVDTFVTDRCFPQHGADHALVPQRDPSDQFFSPEGHLTTMMGKVTWQLPKPNESSRLRAYVSGGAGIVRVRLEDALDAFSSTTSLVAGNAGGGVLVRLRPRLDINADVRYFKTQFGDLDQAGFSEQFVSFTRLTAGVVVRF